MIPLLNDRDIAFQLYEVLDTAALVQRPAYADHSREIFDATLTTARAVAEKYFANHNAIAPQASLTDGLLDVTLWPEVTALEFLSALPPLLSPEGPSGLADVRTAQAKVVEILSPTEIPLRVDNTVTTGTHFRFEVLPNALRVVYP